MFPVSILKPLLIVSKSNSKTRNRSSYGTKRTIDFQSKRKRWKIETQTENYLVEKLILATGSNLKFGKCYKFWSRSSQSSPFLFTFNIKDSRIKELRSCGTGYRNRKRHQTHINRAVINYTLGMSGSNLKLSAWGAFLHDKIISLPFS
jgi:hypothetical protein